MSKFSPNILRFSSYHPWRPWRLAAALAGLLACQSAAAQTTPQLSFPGAEGAGRYTSGGRGTAAVPTTVFEVTSLADTNTPGTLRYALSQPASAAPHRTVVFRVCGTIHLTARLNIPRNTTLAGQTAPGDGICIADRQVTVNGNNVVIRFMRFRTGDRYPQITNIGMTNGNGDEDALSGTDRKNIIIDHCTMSWSMDEAFSFYGAACDSMTLQWNVISEPLNYSYHFETGDNDYERHGYGGIWGGRTASFHHNLFAHCLSRTPRWNGTRYGAPIGSENCDFRNNVIYNWGSNNVYGGEGGNYNIVNNYYKYGPNTTSSSSRMRVLNPYKQTSAPVLPYGKFYMTGNYVDGSALVTGNNWRGVTMQGGSLADTALAKVTTPFAIGPVTTQSATDALNSVLAAAGCVLPTRDPLDIRIMYDVLNRTGAIIDVQGGFPHLTPYAQTSGAWPNLTCGPAPVDSDHDGMPDAWELSHNSDPNDPTDRATVGANGYTNLENYLNGLVVLPTTLSTKQTDGGLGAAPLQAYPNPAGEHLTLSHPRATPAARVTLYDQLGQQVASYAAKPGSEETGLSLRGLSSGLYLVVFADANVKLTTKCVHE